MAARQTVDPDQMSHSDYEPLHSAASDIGLHSLLRPVCPNTLDKYGVYLYICQVRH